MKYNSKIFFTALIAVIAVSQSDAQNVGINNPAPVEPLDVTGNIQFSGALMPGALPGTTGGVLMSQGAGTAPTWGPALMNPGATTGFGKYFVNGITLNANTNLTLTVTDPNCKTNSSIVCSFVGPAGGPQLNHNVRLYNIETQNGTFVVRMTNLNLLTAYTVSLAFIAFY